MNDLPCPACGFLTFNGNYGSYALCPVCDWEDDGLQLANPTSSGGANPRSLADVQRSALLTHPSHVAVAKGYRRGSKWRPLTAAEVSAADALRSIKDWYSSGVREEAEAYWSVRAGQPATASGKTSDENGPV